MQFLLKILLLPFSWLYGAGIYLRNKQYDLQIKKSTSFEIPVISVGNLSTGGTGKTPMIEYLLRLFQPVSKTGVLSRGYMRKTKGFLEVEASMNADQTGDEPLQMKRKFPEVMVAVCEARVIGIPTMIHENPGLEVILLDDAFQHRQVKPGLSLLLTDFARPFTRDHLLPAGRLREPANGAIRAEAIVVTKCPEQLPLSERRFLSKELAAYPEQPVFFSFLDYGTPYSIFDTNKKHEFENGERVLLFCGIAHPESLVEYIEKKSNEVRLMRFNDHHPYSLSDLKKIQLEYENMGEGKKVLITTEKDAVRLLPFRNHLISLQLEIFCVGIEMVFFDNDKLKFDNLIQSYLQREAISTEE